MKIAILTQPLGKNYGGIMQAYALQKTLKDMGHDVVTINHHQAKPSVAYRIARLAYRILNKLRNKRKAPINFEKHYPYMYKDSVRFINSYINQSEYIDSEKKLKQHFHKNSYDAVIVGSDQTWRPKYSPNIFNYYLNFLVKNKDIKKYAYASSFGVDTWEYTKSETKKCSKLAKQFDAVSVRESSGVELCSKHLGISSQHTLDPTLLLNSQDYYKLIGDRVLPINQGIFTYILDDDTKLRTAINDLADFLNMSTYQCQPKLKVDAPNSSNIDDYKMPAVEDWLASFANAKLIVTDSFHGTVFSIIFNKPFIVIKNKQRGASRFESLLDSLGMLERLVDTPDDIKKAYKNSNLLKAPDVNDKLDKLRQLSLHFLSDIDNE